MAIITQPWKILAMYQFDMAVYTKIHLRFPHRFWPNGNGTQFFMYAHEKRGYYTAWQVDGSILLLYIILCRCFFLCYYVRGWSLLLRVGDEGRYYIMVNL